MKSITLRRITQLASFTLFVALICLAAFPLRAEKWIDLFPRMSAHLFAGVALDAWREPLDLAVKFLPGLALLAAAPLLGRFFCGWVCPMGVTLDATDRLLKRHRDDSREPAGWKPLKYYILFAVLAAAYFEVNLFGWIDPMSLVTRSYALVVFPIFDGLARLGVSGLEPAPVIGPIAGAAGAALHGSVLPQQPPQAQGMAWLLAIFAALLFLAFVNRRFWCRFLCPLGAMHALFSRRAAVRRTVSDACTGCGKCVRKCRMGAIEKGGRRTSGGECIECMTCVSVCPEKAVSFRPWRAGAETAAVSLSRRGFVGGAAAAAVAVPVVRAAAAPYRGDSYLIRPPGVWNELDLMRECLRCGECMKVCPTNAIQPSWFETGLEGMWTPRLAPRIGWCEYDCALCGRVCASGAIQELTPDEKHRAVIGVAKFNKNRCIPWAESRECLVCEEHCPVPEKAIRLMVEESVDDAGAPVSVKRPYVVEELCIGCGICENKCPVPGQAAVRVHTIEPLMREASVGGAGIGAVFPAAEVKPWKPQPPPLVFAQDKLFDFIDGGAEIHYEYGFARAATMEYKRGGDALTVDVFEMADARAAYGLFSYENGAGGEGLRIGHGAAMIGGQLALRNGRYYVKVNYFGEGDGEATLRKFAAAVVARTPNPGAPFSPPEPVAAAALPGSILLAEGPLTARNIVDLPPGAGIPFDKAVVYGYKTPAGAAAAVDFSEPPAAEAHEALRNKFTAAGWLVQAEYASGIVFGKK